MLLEVIGEVDKFLTWARIYRKGTNHQYQEWKEGHHYKHFRNYKDNIIDNFILQIQTFRANWKIPGKIQLIKLTQEIKHNLNGSITINDIQSINSFPAKKILRCFYKWLHQTFKEEITNPLTKVKEQKGNPLPDEEYLPKSEANVETSVAKHWKHSFTIGNKAMMPPSLLLDTGQEVWPPQQDKRMRLKTWQLGKERMSLFTDDVASRKPKKNIQANY